MIHRLPLWLKSKYFLTAVGFLVWMLFFDDRDLATTYIKQRRELNDLKTSKLYYQQQIIATREELGKLKNNASTLEQYAREKYLMKRDNEDLFVIEEPKK